MGEGKDIERITGKEGLSGREGERKIESGDNCRRGINGQ